MNFAQEITTLTATELAYLIQYRKVSAIEVVDAYLDRIERINPKINAFCTILYEQAREAAKRADVEVMNGSSLGALHGVPIALKDLTPTAGVRTTRGSKVFADDVPAADAVLVQRVKAAGAIMIGKTNTPEFGHKGTTNNLLFGPTRNPWNMQRTAGASSGGSSAAVAAGLVPIAEGSDGAGSIRIPASMCGVYGFKPTYGVIPDVQGAFTSHTPFFHNGPIARTVTDAARLFQVMAGKHPTDPFSVPVHEDIQNDIHAGAQGLKVAYSPNFGYFEVDPQVAQSCHSAAQKFTELGCQVDEVDLGLDRRIEHSFLVLWCGKLAGMFGHLPDDQLALMEPKVQELISVGKQLSAQEYVQANLVREKVWSHLLSIHKTYDLLLCPTTCVPAFSIDQLGPKKINGKSIDPLLGWFMTYPLNLTGHPVASVPCGFSDDGLPIGLQIIGRRLEDALVFRASRSFERIAPWSFPNWNE